MLIARYCEKICHCDWRNKKLSGQRLARRYSRDFWISGKKGGEGASGAKGEQYGQEEMKVGMGKSQKTIRGSSMGRAE